MNKEKLLSIFKNTIVIIVIMALAVIIFYQNRDRDIFKFGKSESNYVVDNTPQSFNSDSYDKSDVRRVGDKVAYLNISSLSFLDENAEGKKYTVALSNPVLQSDGEYCTVYEPNSLAATVYKEDRQSYSVNLENKIIKAKVNCNGYLFVATEKDGYNCECMIFNKVGEAIFRWDISKSEFIDGIVNGTNDAIIVSVATAREDTLYGEVILIDATDAKIINRHQEKSQLYYNITAFKNGTYAAFSGNELSYFNTDGTRKWAYDFKGKILSKASIVSPDMMVLAFSPGEGVFGGNSTNVLVINRLGKVTAENTYDASIDELAVTDDAIAMVFGKTVTVVDNALNKKKIVENESIIKKMALYSDNKHLFIIGNSESKIIK